MLIHLTPSLEQALMSWVSGPSGVGWAWVGAGSREGLLAFEIRADCF